MDNILQGRTCEEIDFKCGEFTGSIHLLVSLCKRSEMDIYTVKLTDLIEQYFEYINNLAEDEYSMDIVTDFLVTASTLLEIKARAMLPVEQEIMEEEEYIDPEEDLRRRMIEHEMFAEKAQIIKKQETLNRFYREPTFTDKDARLSIKNFDLDKLMNAFASVMYRFTHIEEAAPIKTIERDEFTVADKIESIVETLIDKKQINFYELFGDAATKSEMINTFLALLQLMSKQFAIATQDENFTDIVIKLNPDCEVDKYDFSQLAIDDDDDVSGVIAAK